MLNRFDGARLTADAAALPMRDKLTRVAPLILAAAAVCVLWGGVVADALRIFFGAGLIAFLISPLAAVFEKRLGRALASTLALVCFAAVILGIAALMIPPLLRQSSALAAALPQLADQLRGWIAKIGAGVGVSAGNLRLPSGGLAPALQGIVDSFGELAGRAYQFALMFILGGFLCAGRKTVLLRMELAIPVAWRKNAVCAGQAFLREIRLYMRGQATIALAVGVLSAIGLLILGIEGAIALGLLVGLFNMIPYFGPVLGSVPAVLMALGDGWQKAAFTAAALFLVQQIDGLVISPRVMGDVTGFSPGVVLIALYLSSRIAGVRGMLLALPVMMGLRTVFRVIAQKQEI